MLHYKIDLKTSLVARELRDKLFRVDPLNLTYKFQVVDEFYDEYISVIKDALICVGVLTPVLLDSDGSVIAGQSLVDAAIQIGLDNIPVINFGKLNAHERKICVNSMHRYFDIADLDHEFFLIETQHLLSFVLSESNTFDNLTGSENAAPA
mgnify:CR=1 FL=1